MKAVPLLHMSACIDGVRLAAGNRVRCDVQPNPTPGLGILFSPQSALHSANATLDFSELQLLSTVDLDESLCWKFPPFIIDQDTIDCEIIAMGWFSSSSSSNPPSTNSDPLRDLDPKLRDFLEKESPVKYKTSSPPLPAPQPTTTSSSAQTSPRSTPSTTTSSVPPQSLFPDGRYADLWSTYKPLSDIENSTKTDQERLLDVLDGYKQRKADIGRAALENCALEQSAISDCYASGSMRARMTLCRAENRAFERCYLMQSVCSLVFSKKRGDEARKEGQ